MGHYLINTLWRCQLKCSYCLLPHIKINRTCAEHPWSEWAVALRDHTPLGSTLDFAGGDPLLFRGMAELCDYLGKSGRFWAITTNAMDAEGVNDFMRVRPVGGKLINISDHQGNAKADENIAMLKTICTVVFNRVEHEKAGANREITTFIPYQSWKEGTELDGIRRWCNSGLHHWVADPSGDVFRCNPHMATAQTPIGNLFKRTVVLPEPLICETGCSTCYTSVPDAWPVDMRPVE